MRGFHSPLSHRLNVPSSTSTSLAASVIGNPSARRLLAIRSGNVVNCSGTASDNAALLRMLNQLRGAEGVTDLKVDQIRGKSPMQFTFDFHWNKGGANEN